MRVQTIDVKQSTGRILCCTIFRAGGKKLPAKGRVISEEDARMLQTVGMNEICVREQQWQGFDGESLMSSGRARHSLLRFRSLGRRIAMLVRYRYVLPVLVLLGFGGCVYSDDIPKPDLVGAVQNLQQTLLQLQKEIKDLQSSVKELAKDAKDAQKQRAVHVSAPPTPTATPAAAPASSPAQNWQKAQEAFERGRRSEDLKSYGTAIEAFTETIERDPKNDSALLHRGYSHYYLGDYASAVSDLTQSLALQPHNSRAYAMRASALSSSGKAAEALADIEQAVQKDSRNPENYLLRASLHQQLGQAREALADYGQAIQIAPDYERAYLGRAAILRSHGQVQESLADCYKAIQLNPADTAAYLCRAQFYLSTGAAQPALEDINRAMLIGQKPSEAAALLSEALTMVDDKAQVAPQPQQAPPQPAPPRSKQ
jgi:tetratricopeptide (TPR) repeat protein